MLEFLQDDFSAGLAHSTLKIYMAAIAAYHAPLGGLSVGKTLYLHVSTVSEAREAYAKWWTRMLSYNLESSDLPSPLGVKAHSTQGIAASKAFPVLQRCRVFYAPLELGGIPVHTEYRCFFFLRYEFLKYRNTGVI